MTRFRKTAAVALTALTVAAAAAPAAQARPWRHHGGAVAAGIIGGIAAGALIAGATRPAYAAPVVVDTGPECYRKHVGYTYSGRPVFRTVCY